MSWSLAIGNLIDAAQQPKRMLPYCECCKVNRVALTRKGSVFKYCEGCKTDLYSKQKLYRETQKWKTKLRRTSSLTQVQ